MALFMNRPFENTAAKLLEALERAPNFTVSFRFLAACYAHMGRPAEAREIVRRLRTVTPVVVPTNMRFQDPQQMELLLTGLRLAAGEAT
jgi:Tetratricopeptide repeat